jgi:hypothetical protein
MGKGERNTYPRKRMNVKEKVLGLIVPNPFLYFSESKSQKQKQYT